MTFGHSKLLKASLNSQSSKAVGSWRLPCLSWDTVGRPSERPKQLSAEEGTTRNRRVDGDTIFTFPIEQYLHGWVTNAVHDRMGISSGGQWHQPERGERSWNWSRRDSQPRRIKPVLQLSARAHNRTIPIKFGIWIRLNTFTSATGDYVEKMKVKNMRQRSTFQQLSLGC